MIPRPEDSRKPRFDNSEGGSAMLAAGCGARIAGRYFGVDASTDVGPQGGGGGRESDDDLHRLIFLAGLPFCREAKTFGCRLPSATARSPSIGTLPAFTSIETTTGAVTNGIVTASSLVVKEEEEEVTTTCIALYSSPGSRSAEKPRRLVVDSHPRRRPGTRRSGRVLR